MLDIKLIRDNPELIKEKLKKRSMPGDSVDKIIELDLKRREFIGEVEKMKNLRTVSEQIFFYCK